MKASNRPVTGQTHQDGHQVLTDHDVHAAGEWGVDPTGAVGAAGGGVNFFDQPGQPLPAHRCGREGPVPVLAVAGTAHPEQTAADLDGVPGVDEVVDHRMNPFGSGRSSPSSFAARLRISTSASRTRMRIFAFASSADSWVVSPGRFPRSIWSWRTQLRNAPVLNQSSVAVAVAVAVMVLPARTRATARRRNSAKKGRGMVGASP
jgi:hypothetical protein